MSLTYVLHYSYSIQALCFTSFGDESTFSPEMVETKRIQNFGNAHTVMIPTVNETSREK